MQEKPYKKEYYDFFANFDTKDAAEALSEEAQFLRIFRRYTNVKAQIMLIMFLMAGMTVFVFILISQELSGETTSVETPGIWLVILRWTLAWFIHLILDKDLKQGFGLMKYAMNHTWKFSFWPEGFLVGFFQISLAITIEIYSMLILLSAGNYLDAVKDFIAVVILNDFDNAIFGYFQDDKIS